MGIVPTLKLTESKKLVGLKRSMSLSNNLTGELWKAMSQNISSIPNKRSTDRYSLQVYPTNYFEPFNPNLEFEKWALVEVSDFDLIPTTFERFILPKGLYAVFPYKGLSTDPSIFQYIYSEWLPQSEFTLDDRPHFEVLGDRYQNNHPESEEDIWIPIKPLLKKHI